MYIKQKNVPGFNVGDEEEDEEEERICFQVKLLVARGMLR